jgi:hypothetical protein
MKKNDSKKTGASLKELETYLKEEGFKRLTKEQTGSPEWKASIDSARRHLQQII